MLSTSPSTSSDHSEVQIDAKNTSPTSGQMTTDSCASNQTISTKLQSTSAHQKSLTNEDNLKYYHQIKKFFINLANRTDRLQNTREQVGDDFIRVEATDGSKLSFAEIDKFFNMRKCNKVYRINQTRGQCGATISQFKLYQQVAQDDTIADHDFVLICEDDNTYIPQFKTKLDQLLQFLDQKRFASAQIVILKYLIYHQQFDYYPALKYYNRKHRCLDQTDITLAQQQEPHLVPTITYLAQRDHDLQRGLYNIFRVTDLDRHQFCFEYKGVETDPTNQYYTNTQRLFTCWYIVPFSAQCYLIRKSTCRKITKKFKRCWWYTDDFKQLVPVQDILFASPFFALENDTGFESSIGTTGANFNEFVYSNFWYNKITRERNRYRFNILHWFPFLQTWQYSGNSIKLLASRVLQWLFLTRY